MAFLMNKNPFKTFLSPLFMDGLILHVHVPPVVFFVCLNIFPVVPLNCLCMMLFFIQYFDLDVRFILFVHFILGQPAEPLQFKSWTQVKTN